MSIQDSHQNTQQQPQPRATTEESAQDKVLMELEMILTTVKQIDLNLQTSIDMLESASSRNSLAYKELVSTNTARIKEILELLQPTSETPS